MLNRDDDAHQRANRLGEQLDADDALIVTTHAVVFEVLAYFSRAGAAARARAADLVDRIRKSPTTEFVPSTVESFDAALDLHHRRLDKRYSLTDCVGMIICDERGISEVLTTDRDFEAEGFTILLNHGRADSHRGTIAHRRLRAECVRVAEPQPSASADTLTCCPADRLAPTTAPNRSGSSSHAPPRRAPAARGTRAPRTADSRRLRCAARTRRRTPRRPA